MGPQNASRDFDDRPQVTKFNGRRDFLYWKNKMILILKSKGIWSVVSGSKKQPTVKEEESSSSAFDRVMLDWQNDDDRAMATIALHLEYEPYNIVMRCANSKEVWDTLNARFLKIDFMAQFKCFH